MPPKLLNVHTSTHTSATGRVLPDHTAPHELTTARGWTTSYSMYTNSVTRDRGGTMCEALVAADHNARVSSGTVIQQGSAPGGTGERASQCRPVSQTGHS